MTRSRSRTDRPLYLRYRPRLSMRAGSTAAIHPAVMCVCAPAWSSGVTGASPSTNGAHDSRAVTRGADGFSDSTRSEMSRRKDSRFWESQKYGWCTTSTAESRSAGLCATMAITRWCASGFCFSASSRTLPLWMLLSRSRREPKGWSPRVSTKKNTQPREKMSTAVVCRSPRCCSGARHPSVPGEWLEKECWSVSSFFASPMSEMRARP
mmetsp:Transcript_4902/g.12218  ORF Transcript_4902/g.12218 Transcript_4902/m.12218 type:complete len:209 (-) Transcript_4902:577-1203(-)